MNIINKFFNKFLKFLLVFPFLIILLIILLGPILILEKFGPIFIKSNIDFNNYKYFYLMSRAIENKEIVIWVFVFYFIPVMVIFSTLMTKINIYLKNKGLDVELSDEKFYGSVHIPTKYLYLRNTIQQIASAIYLYLINKIKQEGIEKFYKRLKFYSLISLVIFLFGTYLQLDTYLLIGEDKILYNGLFTFQTQTYDFSEIKAITSKKYPKKVLFTII
jgi:biotin operon repressor